MGYRRANVLLNKKKLSKGSAEKFQCLHKHVLRPWLLTYFTFGQWALLSTSGHSHLPHPLGVNLPVSSLIHQSALLFNASSWCQSANELTRPLVPLVDNWPITTLLDQWAFLPSASSWRPSHGRPLSRASSVRGSCFEAVFKAFGILAVICST